MKNIYLLIPLNLPDLSDLVLATVTGTSGSTPQKAGSSALFNRSGLIFGTIGGGILEGKVQVISRNSAISKNSGYYPFRLDNSAADGEDALCGGRINVLVDANLENHIAILGQVKNSFEARIPGVLITTIEGMGEQVTSLNRYWVTDGIKLSLPEGIMDKVKTEAASILSTKRPDDFRTIDLSQPGDKTFSLIFLEPVIPPLHLIIAGAGHIGKALSKIGQMLDFEVTVIDDRPEFANSENLQSADHIITGDIGSAISQIKKGDDTYIVIVTRGHRDDAGALRACIGSGAGYIGMIGSRNKVEVMHKDFIANGWATEEQWNSIYAPVGLDIRSVTVEEIAVSIAAQLVRVKNAKRKNNK